jgi:transcriptional regulator with XRE-family HTH domain
MLSDTIRALCKEKGITVCELERKTDIANGTVNKWDEDANPRIRTLYAVAQSFGCTVDDLIRGSDMSYKKTPRKAQ